MKVVARNRKAFHEYQILERYEAGIVLSGAEVKSVRAGTVSLEGSYATFERGELYAFDLHIAPYAQAGPRSPDPRRRRKLLLRREELERLFGRVRERGLTLIPLAVYFSPRGYCKLELGLARGRKVYDKRAALKEQELRRERAQLRRLRTS